MAQNSPAVLGPVESSVRPDALTLADQLEDDCLMTGIGRREHLDYRIDAATALRALHAEVSAWRERFKQHEYRPQDDCVALRA